MYRGRPAAARRAHVEPHPRRPRRVEAPLPLPLGGASRLRTRGGDRQAPRARRRRHPRPPGGRCGRGDARTQPLQAARRRRDDRLGDGARPARCDRARRDDGRQHARCGRSSTARTAKRVEQHGIADLVKQGSSRPSRRASPTGRAPTTGAATVRERPGRHRRGVQPDPARRSACGCRRVPPTPSPRRSCAVGLDARDGVYWAGRATLVRRPEDIEPFDRAFAVFFEGRSGGADRRTNRTDPRHDRRRHRRRRRRRTTTTDGPERTTTRRSSCASPPPRSCGTRTSPPTPTTNCSWRRR